MKNIKIITFFLFLMLPVAVFAETPSQMMSFYGRAELNGVPLPVNSVVQVFADGFLQSEVVVDNGGYYASNDSNRARLVANRYVGEQLVFKYVLPGSVVGSSQVKYLSVFKPGKAVQLDLPFVDNVNVDITPNSSNESNDNIGSLTFCSEVSYGSWGDCSSGLQSRDVSDRKPVGCVLTVSQELAKTQACSVGGKVLGVKVYNKENNTVTVESALVLKVDRKLSERLKGRILLQVESAGEAWYVNPKDSKKYYLADGSEAFEIMRYLGIGISNSNLEKIKNDRAFSAKNAGKIFLQVESAGEAWYVDPKDNKPYYLKDGNAAYGIMRQSGLGISNDDLRKISVGVLAR